MTSAPRKEFCSNTAAAFGLLFFGALQAALYLFLQEDIVTFWLARKARFMPPLALLETLPEPPAPEPDRTRPLAVMIDNHPAARPQSGVARAEEVWEVLVEGGLTRLMAVYRSATAAEIGPVRSARPYFLPLARGYDAVYVHVGGSDEALADLASGRLGLDDVNEFREGDAFRRDRSRSAPHNVYTSTAALRALAAGRGWSATTEAVDASLRDAAAPSGAPALRLVLVHSSGGAPTEFRFEDGAYALTRKGVPAEDRDGTRIAPRTVVVLEMRTPKVRDPQGKGLIGVETIGAGKALVFRDGVAVEATWKKTSAAEPLEVFDASGAEVAFAPGQVWYSMIAPEKGGSVAFE